MVDLSVLRTLDVEGVADPAARALIQVLLGLIEPLAAENAALRAENQHLQDELELARLKGGSGKPTLRPQTRPSGSGAGADVSSERQRHVPTDWHTVAKLPAWTVTRTERLAVDPATLPPDAVFKDLERVVERVVVQDLLLQVETVCFESASRRRWGTPPVSAGAIGRCYRAELSGGAPGGLTPSGRAWTRRSTRCSCRRRGTRRWRRGSL